MNYRTNEDRRYAEPYRLTYNSVLGVSFSDEVGDEPVSLDEVKDWIIQTSDDTDQFLIALIKMCRSAMERYTGLGLISRKVTAILNNGRGNIELPYGPLTTFTSLTEKEGEVVAAENYHLYGGSFRVLEDPTSEYITAVYTAGYTPVTIPADLKMDLLRMVAFMFSHRGDDPTKVAAMYGATHRRLTWLL